MKTVLALILAVLPSLSLADLDWGHMSEHDKHICVEGFGRFSKDQYCLALDCFDANSDNIVVRKLDFVAAGFQVNRYTHESNGRCYIQYWR